MPVNCEFSTPQKTIDYKRIIQELANKWYLYLAVLALCAALSLIYSSFIAVPQYYSTAKIYIMNKDSQDINTSELSVSSFLTKDYENLIVDRVVLEEVADKLDLPLSYGKLSQSVSVVNPTSTRFIEVTVKNEDAATAKKIVDKICEISQEKIVEYMGIDRVTIIRKGNLPTSPSSPNARANLQKSLMVGIVLAAILLLIRYLQDDKINDPEDVERFLNLTLLGYIPYNQGKSKTK